MADPEPTKRCPFCAEIILAAAKKCRYCGEFLKEDVPATAQALQALLGADAAPVATSDPPTPAEKHSWTWWIVGVPLIILAAAFGAAMFLSTGPSTPAERAPFSRTDEPASLKTPTRPTQTQASDAEKIKRGCRMAKILYGNKPMSELSMNQMSMIRACKVIGEW